MSKIEKLYENTGSKLRCMCKYETENGICDIAGIPCDKVPLCTEETVL